MTGTPNPTPPTAEPADEREVLRVRVTGLERKVETLTSELNDAIDEADSARIELAHAEDLASEFHVRADTLEERNESIRKLNAFLGWDATRACSGEGTCWCDAHADKRMGAPPLVGEIDRLRARVDELELELERDAGYLARCICDHDDTRDPEQENNQ